MLGVVSMQGDVITLIPCDCGVLNSLTQLCHDSMLSLFQSNSKYDQNFECSGLKYAQSITMKFYAHHDSVTVGMCVKYYCDWLNLLWTRALQIVIVFFSDQNIISRMGARLVPMSQTLTSRNFFLCILNLLMWHIILLADLTQVYIKIRSKWCVLSV